MTILAKILTVVVLFVAPSTAHIISLNLRHDKRHMIPFSAFEFSNVGYVSIVISSMTATSTPSQPDLSGIGFILEHCEVTKIRKNNTMCALDFELSSVLFTFQNLSHSSFNKSFPVPYSGIKSLFFVNCNNESSMTMNGRAELYNMVDGTTKNYLSAGLTEIPFLSFILSFTYLTFLGFWILVCLKNRRRFNRTHVVMGGLLVINFAYCMCVAADLHYVKDTGTAHGLDVLFCVLHLTRAVLLFTVIVLIGVGWFFWKPYLFGDEIMSLTLVILLQMWANVDPIMPWEAALPNDIYALWSWADIFCCFFIFCPITGSFISLWKVCETDLIAYKNLEKLSVFNMVLAVYMVTTRLIVHRLSTWCAIYVVKEASTLVFHVMMFYIFRPVDRTRMIKMANESILPTSMPISSFHTPVLVAG